MAIAATTNRVNQATLKVDDYNAASGVLIGPYRVRLDQKNGETVCVYCSTSNSYAGTVQVYICRPGTKTEAQFNAEPQPAAFDTPLAAPFSRVLEHGGNCNIWMQASASAGLISMGIER